MSNHIPKIFDSSLNAPRFSFFTQFGMKSLYISATLLIGLYILFAKETFVQNPIIYILLGIVGFYSILFITIAFFTKKVTKIKFNVNTIIFTFSYKAKTLEYTTAISTTSAQLFEIKNYKSHFQGIQINFKDTVAKKTFKVMPQNFSYIDLENIYTEFKELKKETIPENERMVFKQLQIINNSTKKNSKFFKP